MWSSLSDGGLMLLILVWDILNVLEGPGLGWISPHTRSEKHMFIKTDMPMNTLTDFVKYVWSNL
jgi:hypothetical protein